MKTIDAYSDQWVDATDSAVIDIAVRAYNDGGWYPAMVQLDFYDNGCSVLSTDARKLGEMLIAAADSADAVDNDRFPAALGGSDVGRHSDGKSYRGEGPRRLENR